MDLGLKGKRLLITGGSRGLGRAIVTHALAEGAIVATCARGQAGLDRLASDLGAGQDRLFCQALDVRDAAAFQAWVQTAAAQLGGVDGVVSNVSTRLSGHDETWWRESFETDFLQHARLAEATYPHLKSGHEPALLFISSIASVLSNLPPDELAYGVMKAGLINYTGQLAARWGNRGIRVNAVSPGPIFFEGGTWDTIKQGNPKLFEAAARLPALGRHGTPDEVAKTALFLLSPAASYITGTNLRIDGGAIRTANF
ncbi:MAG: SDR family NAD(P)-dependent oxidoreductase [Hyphomonadaceae bacterium]